MSNITKQKSSHKSVVVNLNSYQQNKQQIESIYTRQKKLSPELRLLIGLQKSSSVVTLLLITIALTIFGLTVKIPRAWDAEYKKLKTLQRQERQLTMTNEIEKKNLVQKTESLNGNLVYPKPDHALFITVPEETKDNHSVSNQKIEKKLPILPTQPLAY